MDKIICPHCSKQGGRGTDAQPRIIWATLESFLVSWSSSAGNRIPFSVIHWYRCDSCKRRYTITIKYNKEE